MDKYMKAAERLINDERRRQVEKEGWTPAHDDEHTDGSLEKAGDCYLHVVSGVPAGSVPVGWPWEGKWWKPALDNHPKNLVRAGALFRAEAERRSRMPHPDYTQPIAEGDLPIDHSVRLEKKRKQCAIELAAYLRVVV